MKLARLTIVLTLVVLATSCWLTSCSKRPKYVLSEEKMAEVFEDLYVAEAVFRNRRTDFPDQEKKDAVIEGILQKHNITQMELDSSVVWYSDNITLYGQIQDAAVASLQKKKDVIAEKVAKLQSYRISDFTTELPNHYILDNSTPTFRFKIDSIRLKDFDTDKFKFSFTTSGVDTSYHRIEARVYFKYGDSVIIEKQRIYADDYYELLLPERGDSLLREISAYIHLSRVTPDKPKILLNNISNQVVDIAVDSLESGVDSLLFNKLVVDSLEQTVF